jgi:hypothetical protein
MALKLKFRTAFPALVSVISPLTLVKAGLAYTFGFDINALRTSLDAIYAPLTTNYTTVTGTGTYPVAVTDNIILINKTVPAANSVQLPAASSRGGFPITIKDLKGDAATNNITVLPNGAETIDGLLSVVINSNYGSYKFYPAQNGWFILT